MSIAILQVLFRESKVLIQGLFLGRITDKDDGSSRLLAGQHTCSQEPLLYMEVVIYRSLTDHTNRVLQLSLLCVPWVCSTWTYYLSAVTIKIQACSLK